MRVEVCPPEENMERDSEVFLSVEREEKEAPIVRLYKWDRLCLSLGHFQKDKPNLKLPVVRRPTGGGALLHGWDISFAIADIKERWGGKPSSIYRKVSCILREVFEELRVEVRLERFKGRYLDRFYCFWVPTLGELTCGGKKLVAMAMRTGRRAFLVHGSIYTEFDHSRASKLLGVNKKMLESRVISLREMGLKEEDFLKVLKERLSLLQQQHEQPRSGL